MASGNMFRKPRSMSRATNPMTSSPLSSVYYPPSGPQPGLTTSTRRPMQFNPIAPAVADARANAQFDQKFPGNPMSSFDASRMAAGRTANSAYQSGVANGYANPLDSGLDPRSLDAREKLARANAAYMMGGGPASDLTNLAGRFGGAPAVSQASRDAQARMARGQASDQLLGSLVSPGQSPGVVSPQAGNMLNPMYSGPFAKRQADGSTAYTNREGAFYDAFPGLANPSTRDATFQSLMETNPEAARAYMTDQQDREQRRATYDARVQKFKDEHGGMSARQFGIQSRQDKRENARYRKAIMQGLNPMSPQAQGLFPDQTKSFMEQRRANQGVAMKNPMSTAPERTMAGQQQSAQRVAEMASTSPAIAGLGVKPDQGMLGLHTALGARLDEDPNLNLSDDDLKAYQQYAQEMNNLSTDQNNQFDFGGNPWDKYSGELWKELATLPDNQRAREDWLKKYRGRKSATTGAATAPPMAGTYFMGGPVGR